jgi:DinB superfamily
LTRGILTLFTAILFSACAARAQSANPLSTEVKQAYEHSKTTRAAEEMPQADYSFRPASEVRPYGELIAPVADVQTRICSMYNGQPRRPDAASKTPRANLEAALKASFDECDKAYDSSTDAKAAETVGSGRYQRTRLGMLCFNVIHDDEMYGAMGVNLSSQRH